MNKTILKTIALDYNKSIQFNLSIYEISAGWIKGYFEWNPRNRQKLENAEAIFSAANDCWYLDENGDRLEDDLLFAKSPWSIVYDNQYQKIIQRYSNYQTGEAWFCDQPWCRIGDWY